MEGNNYWKLKSAPLVSSKIFFSKFLFVLMPILIIGILLMLFSNWQFRNDTFLMIISSVTIIFLIVSVVSINIGGGSFFSTFNEKNPIRIASTQGASLIFLITLLYLMLTAGSVYLSSFLYFGQSDFKTSSFPSSYLVRVLLFVGTLSIIISTAALVVGIKSLKRDY